MTTADPHIVVPETLPARYAFDIADREHRAVGFLPKTIYQPAWENGRLKIARENDDPCGMILHGPLKKTLRIYQTAIELEARRLENGSDLVEQVIQEAIDANVHQISLHCAEDLEANWFWQSLGFKHVGERVKSTLRGRIQKKWEMVLPAGKLHRQQLAEDPREQTHDRILDLLATWRGNAQAIRKAQARRKE